MKLFKKSQIIINDNLNKKCKDDLSNPKWRSLKFKYFLFDLLPILHYIFKFHLDRYYLSYIMLLNFN